MTTWELEYVWTGTGEVQQGVVVTAADGAFTSVRRAAGDGVPADVLRVPGLTIPGLANAHSHAFHRALRSRTHAFAGSFWTWRELMYEVAGRLDPDSYLALARAVFAEMALAGITTVGEFHYVHHQPGGRPYDDPNAMSTALIEAAADAGVRLTLLDTCYLESAPGRRLEGVQTRFGDVDADAWTARADALVDRSAALPPVRVGAAVHSVRAVPPSAISAVASWARSRGVPLHVHLSEQVAENDACRAAYGVTPAQLLADCGALGAQTTAVHATHLDDAGIALLGESGTGVCYCPTTERDLGDGLPRALDQQRAGSPISLGTDSQAVIDLLEEARGVEGHERLRTQRRGCFDATALLTAATVSGHRALGWDDAGTIEVGSRADFVTLRLDSPRTAGGGATLANAVFAASAADIDRVVVDGRTVVADGHHVAITHVGGSLRTAIERLLG